MKKLILALLVPAVIGFAACNDNETITLQPISVSFSAAESEVDGDDLHGDVALSLSRNPESAVTVVMDIAGNGVEYGTHFTTTPAASNGKVTLTVPANSTTASVRVNQEEGILLDGDEYVSFTISSVSSGSDVKTGSRTTTKAVFGSILSPGDEMQLEGNADGVTAANSVYVDFSQNKQTSVLRDSWQLNFWCGEGFYVTLNGGDEVLAVSSGHTNIDDVDIDDANAVTDEYDINRNPMMVSMDGKGDYSYSLFDTSDGVLSTTAFGAIPANESESEVFFVATTAERTSADRNEWWKVKVMRNGEGYTVKFGRVNDTGSALKTVNIPKDAAYNFKSLSLENAAVVETEPKAAKWDIKWSRDAGASTSMAPGSLMFISDYITINTWAGVTVATVMNVDMEWEDITPADIAALDFTSKRDALGDTWRSLGGGMPPSGGGVKTDRFYVIKDSAGNYYKMKFLRGGFSGEAGTRGRPELEYKLLKEAGE